GITNQYPRTYLRAHAPSNSFVEFYASQRTGSEIEISDDSLNRPGFTSTMFAFEGGTVVTMDAVDSARFAQQKNGFVPAISLRIGTAATLGVTNSSVSNTAEVNVYPNPANDVLNVSVGLGEKAHNVTYTIIDLSGKTLKRLDKSNV